MYAEKLSDGKIKFIEYYKDPYSEKRRRVSITVDKDTPQVRNKAAKYLQKKIDEKLSQDTNHDLTFEEVFKQFYEQWELSVKESSKITLKKVDQRIVERLPKNILMRNITKSMVQKIINDLYKEGYSEASLRKHSSRYKQIFDYAEDHNYIEISKIKRIKVPKRIKTPQEIEMLRNNYFNQDDVQKIVDYLKANHNIRSAIISQVLFLTGMRYGELIGLTEKDIDYQNKKISINGTYSQHLKKKTTPKNDGSNRTITVTEYVLNLIDDYKKLNLSLLSFDKRQRNSEKFIFLSNHGFPLTLSNYNLHIQKAVKELGLPQKATSHIFRHSHISLLIQLEMPLKQIMDRVGHVNSNTTLKIYSHVTQVMQVNLGEQLNKITF